MRERYRYSPIFHICRVTTCLENLERSGNLTAVREMSGILLKVREVSRKSYRKLFIVSCTFASILDFAELCSSFWFWIMHCCIPTPTTDNNTSICMMWLTLDVSRSATNCQGNVMELAGNFTLSGDCGHPVYVNESDMKLNRPKWRFFLKFLSASLYVSKRGAY